MTIRLGPAAGVGGASPAGENHGYFSCFDRLSVRRLFATLDQGLAVTRTLSSIRVFFFAGDGRELRIFIV